MRSIFPFLAALAAACALASSCGAPAPGPASPARATEGDPAVPDLAGAFRDEALALAAGLGTADLAGQLMMVAVDGRGSLPEGSRRLLESVRPGAILLFGFNVPTEPADLGRFLGELQDAATAAGLAAPVLAAIDHEGGAVFRFRSGLTRIPAAAVLGGRGEAAAAAAGKVAGGELRSLGVALNLAPVAEAAGPGSFLERRAFSADPARSGALAAAFARALQAEDVAAALKHWPGSGDLDPHLGLPTLDVDQGGFGARYERPFADALRAGPAAVMLSHVVVPVLDPDSPATWSAAVIGRLRALGFRGLVLTDDVAMKASLALLPAGEAAVAALAAGADMVMVSGGPYTAEVAAALRSAIEDGTLPLARAREAVANVLALKAALGLDRERDPALREARLEALPALIASHAGALD